MSQISAPRFFHAVKIATDALIQENQKSASYQRGSRVTYELIALSNQLSALEEAIIADRPPVPNSIAEAVERLPLERKGNPFYFTDVSFAILGSKATVSRSPIVAAEAIRRMLDNDY